jgi:hypothetical protein
METLASERNQQHRADIGMRAEAFHDPLSVGVRVTTGKTDQMYASVAPRKCDLARDAVGTLDKIDNHHMVPDALAAVLPPIAFHV